MSSQIEINIVFSEYEQNSFEGFNRELLELAKKWKLQTKTTEFSIIQITNFACGTKEEGKVKRLGLKKAKKLQAVPLVIKYN
jgi:hypothetical protein